MQAKNDCELLKVARKKLGWTQKELANYYGVQREVISYWESGKRPIPKEILGMPRKVQRLSKEKAVERFNKNNKNSGKKPELSKLSQENVTESAITSIPDNKRYGSKTMLLHSLEENLVISMGVSAISGNSAPIQDKKPEFVEFEIPKESTRERELLDGLIAFKRNHKNRYPTKADFNAVDSKGKRKIWTYSLKEIKDCFGSLQKAKRIATEIRKIQKQEKESHTKPCKAVSKCSLCGNWVVDIDQHYDDMRAWINLILNTTKGKIYQDVVLDLKNKILFPEKCFCGGKIKNGWKSSLRIILNMRFESLFQSADSRSPLDVVQDCKNAIFGEERI